MKTVLTLSCLVFSLSSYSQVAVQKNDQKANPKEKAEVRGMVYASELKMKSVAKPKGIVLEASKPKKVAATEGK